MAESCLAFLSLDLCMGEGAAIWQAWDKLVQHRRVYLTSSIKSYPFAEYVTRFWPSHFRHCQRLSNGEVVSDVGETFRSLYRSIFPTAPGRCRIRLSSLLYSLSGGALFCTTRRLKSVTIHILAILTGSCNISPRD